MVLADTSIWIDHLRRRNDNLVTLLDDRQVITHPFVIGELAIGSFHNRAEILSKLKSLPMASVATDPEVLFFIDQRKLAGRGIGYIDVHLLTATLLVPSVFLWTRDKNLREVATSLERAHNVN